MRTTFRSATLVLVLILGLIIVSLLVGCDKKEDFGRQDPGTLLRDLRNNLLAERVFDIKSEHYTFIKDKNSDNIDISYVELTGLLEENRLYMKVEKSSGSISSNTKIDFDNVKSNLTLNSNNEIYSNNNTAYLKTLGNNWVRTDYGFFNELYNSKQYEYFKLFQYF